MRERQPCVCIPASGRNGTPYIGVTSNLIGRIIRDRAGTFECFAKRYGVTRLTWFDIADTMDAAVAMEKRIRRWPRACRLNLIEQANPRWRDLAVDLGLPELGSG